MRNEKRIVQQFYDEYGWVQTDTGMYKDTAAFVDTRPVLAEYQGHAMKRLSRALRPAGRLFLDAGCGAFPCQDYIGLSTGYESRVCVDLACAALREARAKLGPRALCVQADITRLPFRDGAFEAELCAHVLYHIPADEQAAAIDELHRTLAPNGRCVIVYTWPDCFMNRLAICLNPRVIVPRIPGARSLWRAFLKPKKTGNVPSVPEIDPGQPPLYFHPHPRSWFKHKLRRTVSIRVRCLQSVGLPFSGAFVPANALGKWLLRVIAVLEDAFPRTMARVGCYPLIIVRR